MQLNSPSVVQGPVRAPADGVVPVEPFPGVLPPAEEEPVAVGADEATGDATTEGADEATGDATTE